MDSLSHSKKRINVFSFLLVLVLAVAFAIAVIAYVMEQAKVADKQDRIEALQTKVDSLQTQVNKKDTSNTTEPTNTTEQTTTYKSEKGTTVTLYTPESGDVVASPLGVIGKIPGSWSFEASFPVLLKDANGKTIVQEQAKVQGDWMTDKDVPFAVTVIFDKPTTSTGTLVLQKDNPSGLAENEDSVSIPVKFE